MSRFGDDYDGEDFPGQGYLWHANLERALKGKRGRKTLADLRAALLALPQPRLIEGALCTVNAERRAAGRNHLAASDLRYRAEEQGEGVCAVGALLWHRKVKAGMDPAGAFDSLPTLPDSDYDLHDTAQLAVRDAGLVYCLAYDLAYRNDETYQNATPEERYTAFLGWIDHELAGASS